MYGTRPEAVKIAPVVSELRRCGVEPTIIATGQHQSLLKGTPAENVLTANLMLGLHSANDPVSYARVCEKALAREFRKNRPAVILVQGDTASAYAGARVGAELGIPVAHVEAGIRTGDLADPWPEEGYRVAIDAVAKWRFFPSQHAMNHYHPAEETSLGAPVLCESSQQWRGKEFLSGDWITGNTGIDALFQHTRPIEHPHTAQDRVLITLHRRESFGAPLERIVRGITTGAAKYAKIEFQWPTHPNPKVQEALPAQFPSNLILTGPLPTVAFAQMLAASRAVITDSGGVQEEAAALGVPCIVARDKTDRPESVDLNLATVAGRTEQGIVDGLCWALGFQARCTPSDCFGDGHAAPRIVKYLLSGT